MQEIPYEPGTEFPDRKGPTLMFRSVNEDKPHQDLSMRFQNIGPKKILQVSRETIQR